jgi:hypothetical protein
MQQTYEIFLNFFLYQYLNKFYSKVMTWQEGLLHDRGLSVYHYLPQDKQFPDIITGLPSPLSWAVGTIRGWSTRALPLSSILTTRSGCAFTGTSVISMPLSRRSDRVFRLFMRSYGPKISLDHRADRLNSSNSLL